MPLWPFRRPAQEDAESTPRTLIPAEVRRLIYTTNTIEGYNRQLRKVIKNKASFPLDEAARKLLYLANVNITRKWSMPIYDWAKILNQLAIRFEGRFPL